MLEKENSIQLKHLRYTTNITNNHNNNNNSNNNNNEMLLHIFLEYN